MLKAFESALVHALHKQWTFEFPAAWAGPRSFLQAVEDLLGLLLTRPGEGFEHFVNWLDPTVIRVPQRLDRQPKARPWLGDFSLRIRLGFLSHLAALLGGRAVRQRLFAFPSSRLPALLAAQPLFIDPHDVSSVMHKPAVRTRPRRWLDVVAALPRHHVASFFCFADGKNRD
jgi:hypothetical protein